MTRSGANLAMLLLAGFRTMVDAVVTELVRRGHPDVRPVHEFAMRAIVAGADSAGELGRRLSVSKQAAAKTILALQERGYVTREPDPADTRRKRLQVTPRGLDMMQQGEALFGAIRERWEQQIGVAKLAELEGDLVTMVGSTPDTSDMASWLARTGS